MILDIFIHDNDMVVFGACVVIAVLIWCISWKSAMRDKENEAKAKAAIPASENVFSLPPSCLSPGMIIAWVRGKERHTLFEKEYWLKSVATREDLCDAMAQAYHYIVVLDTRCEVAAKDRIDYIEQLFKQQKTIQELQKQLEQMKVAQAAGQ